MLGQGLRAVALTKSYEYENHDCTEGLSLAFDLEREPVRGHKLTKPDKGLSHSALIIIYKMVIGIGWL